MVAPGEEVDVVGHAAGCEEDTLFRSEDPADVFVEAGLEIRIDQWEAVLGGEDEVVVEIGECASHGESLEAGGG